MRFSLWFIFCVFLISCLVNIYICVFYARCVKDASEKLYFLEKKIERVEKYCKEAENELYYKNL